VVGSCMVQKLCIIKVTGTRNSTISHAPANLDRRVDEARAMLRNSVEPPVPAA
jgi:hypothetical protein